MVEQFYQLDKFIFAPAGIELLNLWNDFRKIVKFIGENPWVKTMLEKIMEMKNIGNN